MLLPWIGVGARSQVTATAARPSVAGAQPQTGNVEEVPQVPGVSSLLRGFNAGLTVAGVHDSSAGWYSVATPAISYNIARHYSVDASVSIYPYRKVQSEDNFPPFPYMGDNLVVRLGEVGDTPIGVHASFRRDQFYNTSTASFTIPTGNRTDGLSTGRVTFDASDHMEGYVKQAGFLIDVGGGDSSALFNRLVTREDYSLGPLVHFQAGPVFYLFGGSRLQSVAYEQLPLGDQKLFTIVSSPHGPSTTEVTGSGVSEDNGVTTAFSIPLSDHLTASGYYNRSLREHLDTVSGSLTYVLRGSPRSWKMSMIDKALREAAGTGK
jgi:hypothetical protein